MTKDDCLTYLTLGRIVLLEAREGMPEDQLEFYDKIVDAIGMAGEMILLDIMADRVRRKEDDD